jgi:GTP-binding protein
MKILKAEFVKGVVGDDYAVNNNLPQIVFFGRSNAGKSSVINSLTGRKSLVRVSKNPGETKEANFYRINDAFYLVDFPGYGYSKFSMKMRNKMAKRILWYVEKSKVRPKVVFLITDIKVGLTDLDREMIDILKKNNHNINIIGNKADKLGKMAREKKAMEIKEEEPDIPVFLYSAKTKEGKEEIIENIAQLIKEK